MARQIILPNPITIAKNLTTGGVGITQPGPTNAQAVGAVEKTATAVPDFISRLTAGNLWLRIAEVALGAMLVIVGIGKLTGISAEIRNVSNTVGKLAPAVA